MDFTISTKEHRAAAEAAADALPRRSGILPALTLVRIEAHRDGRITYEGTDLEFSIQAEVRGSVAAAGSLCLAGHQLAKIASESDKQGQTRIRLDAGTAVIEAGYETGETAVRRKPATFHLAAAPPSDCVGGPTPATTAPVTVSGDLLRAMASRVAWLASKEESRCPHRDDSHRPAAGGDQRAPARAQRSGARRTNAGDPAPWSRRSSSPPPSAC